MINKNLSFIFLSISAILLFSSCTGSSGSLFSNNGTTITGIDNDTNITHNGTTYGTVISPYTGRIWLDRNLGASEVCSKSRGSFTSNENYNSSQMNCYGDYYQWGREHDGHQESNSTITTILATSITSVGNSFIQNSSSSYDWSDIDDDGSVRSTNWSKIDGTSICPIGYRVPTIEELKAEVIDLVDIDVVQNRDDAFNNFLKLPSAGARRYDNGSMHNPDSWGVLWTISADGFNSYYLSFKSDTTAWGSDGNRASALSVRCVMD
ncbi:MAG: FISUMP domain-containing protein [Campylobacterota bacterium]|nr:FISUMP domain-containing protein [Campylobacterota bacterium]